MWENYKWKFKQLKILKKKFRTTPYSFNRFFLHISIELATLFNLLGENIIFGTMTDLRKVLLSKYETSRSHAEKFQAGEKKLEIEKCYQFKPSRIIRPGGIPPFLLPLLTHWVWLSDIQTSVTSLWLIVSFVHYYFCIKAFCFH